MTFSFGFIPYSNFGILPMSLPMTPYYGNMNSYCTAPIPMTTSSSQFDISGFRAQLRQTETNLYTSFAQSRVASANQGITALKQRLETMLATDGVSDEDKEKINELLQNVETVNTTVKTLSEDETAYGESAYIRACQIGKDLTALANKVANLTQTINAYLQPQSSSDDSVTPSENVSNGYSTEGMQQVQNSPMLASVSDDVKTKILDCVKRACEQYNVDPRLVIALMKTESSFNPNAKSSAGAIGLMQLMPETAKSCGATNPYDIEQNIFAGVKYLKEMLDRYNGNVDLALAAYNAGPGKVTDKIPDIAETKNHVAEVNKNYQELMA